MLFDEVAIDPECVCDDGVLEVLRHRFGWSHGRLISAVPTNWQESVRLIANRLPDGLQKSRIKAISGKLPLVEPATGAASKGPWMEIITELHQRHPLDGIIANEPPDEPRWFSPDRVDEYIDESEERVGHFEIAHQQPTEIVKTLTGFLRVNKRLVLVNPNQWFYQDRRSTVIFEEMFKKWIGLGGISMRVIRSMRKDYHHWASECERLDTFLRKIKYKGDFTFIAVQDDARRLHERYLIGSVCGLELGYGLETGSKPQTWKLLRQASYINLKKAFLDQDIRDTYKDFKTWRHTR
jgi:hypothetical protein